MTTDTEKILAAMQTQKVEFRAEMQAQNHNLESLLQLSREELKAEVKRWDDRFFKFAEDSTNPSNTLIASATISVIAGVVLLLLRQ